MDCEDGETGRVQLLESCECRVTESLFYTLGGRQSEHRIYYLNWNNLEMKGGTLNICARTTVITWYCPGQTGTYGDTSNWETAKRSFDWEETSL